MENLKSTQLNPSGEGLFSDRKVQAEYVKAKISQEFDVKIKVQIIPSADIGRLPFLKRCMPRKGGDRRDAEPLDLPESIKSNFKEINAKVMEWLNASLENRKQYMSDPVNSLIKAGIKLTNADQKALSRNFKEVQANMIVAPGFNIKDFKVSAGTKERNTPGKSTGSTLDSKRKLSKDCGCS